MRSMGVVLAVLILSGPALAQGWQEFTYADDAFTVMFPAAPKVEKTMRDVAEGRSVPARVYSVRQDKGEFTVTVADLANSGLQESMVIDYALKQFAADGTVKIDIPHRIYQVYGRQLSVEGKDGSRSTVAVFDVMGRLYEIEAKVFPGGSDIDLIRFQQSLVFERGVSNRSAEAIRAIKEGCKGAGANPAGLDDPRCQLVQ